jgi:hypothetical protein
MTTPGGPRFDYELFTKGTLLASPIKGQEGCQGPKAEQGVDNHP